MSRLFLCLATSMALSACGSTARAAPDNDTIQRVCTYNGYMTEHGFRVIQRKYGEPELTVAREVLRAKDQRQRRCWGRAGLVLAVLESGEAFPLLRSSVEAMARIDDKEIRTAFGAELLMSVGFAARFSQDEASKAAIVEYLAQLSEPAWWIARGHAAKGSAIGRSRIALAALSQTASHRADQIFATLLQDEQLEAKLGTTIKSYVEGLKLANQERMTETRNDTSTGVSD